MIVLMNRKLVGRYVQLLYRSDWRRSRGYWPRRGKWPVIHFWVLGPVELRFWTAVAMQNLGRSAGSIWRR